MRKKISLITLIFTLTLQNGSANTQEIADMKKISELTAMLRKFDLNEQTQNEFAITQVEYEELQTVWQSLSQVEKNELLFGATNSWWRNTCAMALFYDLNSNVRWETHSENLSTLGRRGISLTISLQNNPMSLEVVRNMLVDLLQDGPAMVSEDKLNITDEIKMQASVRAGEDARRRLERWQQLINDSRDLTTLRKLKTVNEFFNKEIQPKNDQGSTKQYDYWQSPIETLVRGIGDCDDFAMAKYVSLRLLGIPSKQLRVAAFKGSQGGHSVLIVYPKKKENPLVLDCFPFKALGYIGHHILKLNQWTNINKMKLLYQVNEDTVRLFDARSRQKGIYHDPIIRLPKFGMALNNSRRVLPPRS